MKLFLIFVAVIVPLINARSLKGRETNSCIADYLTSIGLIQDGIGSGQPPNALCSAIVDVTKNGIMESVHLQVLSDEDMREDAECIMNFLGKSSFGNHLLVTYVYETTEGIDEVERAKKLKSAESKIAQSTFDSFMACQAEKKFGQLFDGLLEKDSSSDEDYDPKEDYCFRKRIIELDLVSVRGLEFDVNPKGIETSDADCSVIYPKALKDAEDELVKSLAEDNSNEDDNTQIDPAIGSCLIEVIKKGNYIDHMLQYDYLKEFKLDSVQKDKMRKNFIIVMTKLGEHASKCFL